jgi:hypothetical protein
VVGYSPVPPTVDAQTVRLHPAVAISQKEEDKDK